MSTSAVGTSTKPLTNTRRTSSPCTYSSSNPVRNMRILSSRTINTTQLQLILYGRSSMKNWIRIAYGPKRFTEEKMVQGLYQYVRIGFDRFCDMDGLFRHEFPAHSFRAPKGNQKA